MENEHINPWRDIWIHPRKTMRFLLEKDPKWMVILLTILGGVVAGFAFASMIWAPFPPRDLFHKVLLLVVLAITSAILSLIHLYLNGWLLSLTGSWLGGKGKFIDLKCAVGWSNYPFIFGNIAIILSAFARNHIWLASLFNIIQLVIVVWGFIIFLKLIAEAHLFSFWKALLAFIISFVLIAVVFMIISLLVPLLSPLFQ